MSEARLIYGPSEVDAGSRRILLVSPEFPPSASAGALRWQEMSRFFASAGWQIDVLTIAPSDPLRTDWTRCARLPESTRVHALPWRTAWVERALLGLWRLRPGSEGSDRTNTDTAPRGPGPPSRAPSDFRDTVRVWVEDTTERHNVSAFAAAGIRLFARCDYRAVISCGPPHWAHEAALRLVQARNVPLVIDLRDPWAILEARTESQVPRAWAELAAAREREVFDAASLVVMNTEAAAQAMRVRYSGGQQDPEKVISIRNGFDRDSVRPRNEGGSSRRSCFRVAYAGTIYLDRDPTGLFAAAAELVEAESLGRDEFGLLFVGANDPVALRAEAERWGLTDYLEIRPVCPHTELLEILTSASVLVSLPQGHDLAVPSKIYEYMHFEAWLLAIATPDSATAQLLKNSEAIVADPSDPAEPARSLRDLFESYRSGRRAPDLASNPAFGREAQARKLIEAIETRGIA